jgi:hypothetical protein
MKNFTNKNIIELLCKGYTKVSIFNNDEVKSLIDECELLHQNFNNNDFINTGISYPSKGHVNKKSLILMVSHDENKILPSTNDIGDLLKEYLKYNNDILFRVTGISVPLDSRYMINYRKYLGETEPVFEHFDGEYLKGFIDEPNYHFFDEALLPRFVSLLTLDTGRECEGAVIVNVISGEEINPCCDIGEMFIFDNIRFKHHVPRLIKPRIMLGIRNFDFLPYHYVLEPLDGYVTLADKINYGYVKPIGNEEAKTLMLKKFALSKIK